MAHSQVTAVRGGLAGNWGTVMEWMLMPYRKLYPAIAGRSSRQEFWMFALLNLIIAIVVVALVVGIIGASSLSMMNLGERLSGGVAGVGIVAIILLVIPLYFWAILTGLASFAVTIRRFHDLNLSGWVYLPFMILGFIPLVNFLSVLALIVMMCVKGTSGPNKFGDDPTNPVSTSVFE